MITAGGVLKEGRFSRLGVMQLQAVLGAITPEGELLRNAPGSIPEAMQQKLAEMWDKYADPLMQALEVRRGERSTSLQRDLQNRAEKEIADITAILTELQKSILKELEEPQVEQLTLEQEQFERNMNSLKASAEHIPREIEQETSLIRKRFENPTARLFPLAVTFLVLQRFR